MRANATVQVLVQHSTMRYDTDPGSASCRVQQQSIASIPVRAVMTAEPPKISCPETTIAVTAHNDRLRWVLDY